MFSTNFLDVAMNGVGCEALGTQRRRSIPLCGTRFVAFAALTFLLNALCVPGAHAQSTVTAASCNESDVNAVINGPTHKAVGGDTINVPAGNCTWTSGFRVPAGIGISIIGAGAASTTITDNYAGTTPLIWATPQPGAALMRISGMTVQPQSGASLYSPFQIIGTCNSGGCPNMRFDNMVIQPGWTGQAGWIVRVDNMYGVFDHNTVNGSYCLANVNHSGWLGVGQWGDNSWASPDSYGTNAAIFFEDNTFNGTATNDTDASDAYADVGGGRVVTRHNTFNNAPVAGSTYFHGTESGGRMRGGRQVEFYNNTVSCAPGNGCDAAAVAMRSGVGLIYNNNFSVSGGAWINAFVRLYTYRTFAGFGPSWGYCDGQGPFDQNDGTVYASGTVTAVITAGGALTITDLSASWGLNQWVNSGNPYSIVYTDVTTSNQGWTGNPGFEITANTNNTIVAGTLGGDASNWNAVSINIGNHYQIKRANACIDQPGRSGGTLLSGDPPAPLGWVNEVIDPVYEWGNSMTGGSPGYGSISSDSAKVIANRDYYTQAASFDGSSGTGSGVLSSRPSGCTTGVVYWATDQNMLYKCTAANTWTSSYTPYTYPHPLVSGSGGTSSNPAPPTGLSATVQ
jgi:hypothetical protein